MTESSGASAFEIEGLGRRLAAATRLIEAESFGLLADADRVDQNLLDQIASDRVAEGGFADDVASGGDLESTSRRATLRALELAEAGRQLQSVLFDCPLDAPPSPVQWHWRPAPIARMVFSCEHGPPEHCWHADGDFFAECDCP